MKNQTKEIIFNGALKAFSERGFNETNMEEIAKVCGIAKGTLYYNFKNKQDLYIYILKMGMERFVQDIRETMSQVPKDQVETRIHKLIQVHVEFIGREPDFCRLLVSKGWVSQEQHFNIRQVLADYFDFMEAEIDSGKFYGKISSKLDAKTTANCLFGIYIFAPMRSMVWGETMNLQEVRESIEIFVCNALGIHH
ncbi:transcriptional regulator [Paenibacillus sp. IHB B 3084]|nr:MULTISPECIES: TetR/AcrR family transcriptional regulator [unclassified Paenibacillus]ALP35672.1 transcriptional regulator [Paenibacillus sp. IHB B 3084]MBE0335163.1 TetR/AcrR family transcriptional regulator [Paenibacillus sp. 23TSA30-6]